MINLGLFWRNPELSVFDNLIHRTMSIVEIYNMDIMANNITKCGKFLIFSLHCKIWERLGACLSFWSFFASLPIKSYFIFLTVYSASPVFPFAPPPLAATVKSCFSTTEFQLEIELTAVALHFSLLSLSCSFCVPWINEYCGQKDGEYK